MNGREDLSAGGSSSSNNNMRAPLLLPDPPHHPSSTFSPDSFAKARRLTMARRLAKERARARLGIRLLWKRLRNLRHFLKPQSPLICGNPVSRFNNDWGLLKDFPSESLALSSTERNLEIERETPRQGEDGSEGGGGGGYSGAALAISNGEPEPKDGDLGPPKTLPSESLAPSSRERKTDVERENPWADGDYLDRFAASNDEESALFVSAELRPFVEDYDSLSKLPEDLSLRR